MANNTHHEQGPAYYEEDEITLKELILKLKEFYLEVKKNWILLGLIMLPFISYMVYKSLNTPINYIATTTFMVNEDEGGMSGAMSILNQFGFGGQGGEFNYPKILELAKSRKIIQEALFEEVEIEGNSDFIANHIIDIYNFHEPWAKGKAILKDFYFKHNDISQFDRKENLALQRIHKKIIGGENIKEPLMSSTFDDESSILSIDINSTNEQLSFALLNNMYSFLSEFYILKSTERQAQTVKTLRIKTDSVKSILSAKEYELAKFKDVNRNVYLHTEGSLKELRLQRDLQVLGVMYGELLKNLETADFSLKNATPFFAVIEDPILPLSKMKPSLLKNLVIGIFLGLFLGITFIIGRKIVQDTMAD